MTVTAMKAKASDKFAEAKNLLEPVIIRFEQFVINQPGLAERLLVALLVNGHVLLKGVPGNAKTWSGRVMSALTGGGFARLQFNPEMMPSDIVGTRIYHPSTESFDVELGPIFVNFVLADEINRAGPKTQSALLEAMGERQVTIAGKTIVLQPPFMVLATQNPLEHEGTYPLPEAQLDRFMFEVIIHNIRNTEDLVALNAVPGLDEAQSMLGLDDITRLQSLVDQVSVSQEVTMYAASLVAASHTHPSIKTDDETGDTCGISPRRYLWFIQAAKALALIRGRSYVEPGDIRDLAPDAFRHVIILSEEAVMEGKVVRTVIKEVIASVTMPKGK